MSTISADQDFLVETLCPICGGQEDLDVSLEAQLRSTVSGAKLGVKVVQKTVDHVCRVGS